MSEKYGISGHKKCRLCLRTTAAYIDLFQGNFQEMILELTSLEISVDDGYPKTACIICIDEIQQATKTRRRILDCHEKLMNLNVREMKNDEIVVLSDFSEDSDDIGMNQDDNLEEILTYNEVDPLQDLMIKTEMNDDSLDLTYEDFPEENLLEGEEEKKAKRDILLYNPRKTTKRAESILKPERHFTCEDCGESFSGDRHVIYLHRMKHKKSICKICGSYIRSDNLKRHLESHTSGTRVCDLCGVTCKNIESLRGHIYHMHRKAPDQYKCDQCPRSYRVKSRLDEHKNKEHIGVKKYTCTVCQKKFFTAKNVRNHINMTHEKLRPHICNHCGKGFSSKYALKTHTRQHTNESPYKCSICAEGFRQNISLRNHLKSKHNIEEDKNFPCEFCDKLFGTRFALKVHLRMHTDNNYKCEDCQEFFHEKIYLLNHLKKIHNKEESEVDIMKFRTNPSEKCGNKDNTAEQNIKSEMSQECA